VVSSSFPKFQSANHRVLCHSLCYRNVTSGVPGSKSPQGHPKVTVPSGKVTVTVAISTKITWQAGMSRGMSAVRSYVRLPVTETPGYSQISNDKAGKSEKHPWQAGMYKGMSGLEGYVACRERDNWDFREILHRMGR
jgi:hypothetical protein